VDATVRKCVLAAASGVIGAAAMLIECCPDDVSDQCLPALALLAGTSKALIDMSTGLSPATPAPTTAVTSRR
jgi:hypothetical protein